MGNQGTTAEKGSYWASKKDVAAWLRSSERHVSRLADSGRFPQPKRVGRLLRWRWLDLEEWASTN